MKSLRQRAITMTLLCCLTGSVWAEPRVAIVTPLAGQVKLAGATLTGPKLAEEGQKLTLGAGGEVRIQLLGSSKETVIKGVSGYTVSKAALEKNAKTLSRGKVTVSKEIGNLDRAAAAASRVAVYHPVGLTFSWPPRLDGGQWVSQATTPSAEIVASESSPVEVTIADLSEPKNPTLRAIVAKPIGSLAFAEKNLLVGHRYKLSVQRGTGEQQYSRIFRILSPEEQQAIAETERALRAEATPSETMSSLLRLANLYQSFDQTQKVAEVLLEAVKDPEFVKLDPAVKLKLVEILNKARNGLDLENYKA